MRSILVIGLTGQFRESLMPGIVEDSQPVFAISREQQAPVAGVEWLPGSLQSMPEIPAGVDTVLSLGPLDAFVDWFCAEAPTVSRVVALGSTGRVDKMQSTDPSERDLAKRLQSAESRLFEAGHRRNIAVTVLRPTLLYGSGRDLTLSRLIRLGRRWGVVVLPSSATGLRQPVHVQDIADAIRCVIDAPQTSGQAYDLPGGEVLSFKAMVGRTLQRHAPRCHVISVPTVLIRIGLKVVAVVRRAPIGPGLLERLELDQLADGSAAHAAFGYRARLFEP